MNLQWKWHKYLPSKAQNLPYSSELRIINHNSFSMEDYRSYAYWKTKKPQMPNFAFTTWFIPN